MGLVMLITLTVKQRVCGTSQNLIKTSIVGVAACYCAHTTSSDLNKARDDGVLGWQWHQMDHTQTICNSLQTDNNNNTSSLNLYRPDALPDAQPTVSRH